MHAKNRIDLTGQVFSKLKVISADASHVFPSGQQIAKWIVQCACGRQLSVIGAHLRNGNTKSCGCLQREMTRERSTKHGCKRVGKQTPEYTTWQNIRARCFMPYGTGYAAYGALGIRVCSAWRDQFETFLRDMGAKPSPLHSIDRIDGNGHYSCGKCVECKNEGWSSNCRWATRKEQSRNMKTNLRLTYKGETHTAAEWTEILGLGYWTLYTRLKNGWTVEQALSTPLRLRKEAVVRDNQPR